MPSFLISGATGQQGGAVVKALLESGTNPKIFALSRSPDSPAATKLKEQGVQIVKGSFSDAAALEAAMKGLDGAFLITDNSKGVEAEAKSGKAFVDAAKKAELPFLVYTSVDGAERKSGVPHFDSKFEVEEYLRASKIPHTILRPVAFYENLGPVSGLKTFLFMGVFQSSLGTQKKLQMVSIQDIGWFGAQALLNPSKYKGRAIALAGDDLTVPEMAVAYGKASGRGTAWTAPWFMGAGLCRLLPYDFRMMNKWFATDGYTADIAKLKVEHPKLMSFEEWIKKEQHPKSS